MMMQREACLCIHIKMDETMSVRIACRLGCPVWVTITSSMVPAQNFCWIISSHRVWWCQTGGRRWMWVLPPALQHLTESTGTRGNRKVFVLTDGFLGWRSIGERRVLEPLQKVNKRQLEKYMCVFILLHMLVIFSSPGSILALAIASANGYEKVCPGHVSVQLHHLSPAYCPGFPTIVWEVGVSLLSQSEVLQSYCSLGNLNQGAPELGGYILFSCCFRHF